MQSGSRPDSRESSLSPPDISGLLLGSVLKLDDPKPGSLSSRAPGSSTQLKPPSPPRPPALPPKGSPKLPVMPIPQQQPTNGLSQAPNANLFSTWELNGWSYSDLWVAGQGVTSAPTVPETGRTGINPFTGAGYTGSRDIEPSAPQPGARRPGQEFNHNKAITKRLAGAVHHQQVLDVIAESVHLFDEVNVATALHRLAKLQSQGQGNQARSFIATEQFKLLVAAIRRLLPRFEAQAVSNTLWAFATLGYYPDSDILDHLGDHAVVIIHTFRPQATANSLWAYAKLGYMHEALLVAAAKQMMKDLNKSVPQDISNSLWAYATLRYGPGDEFLKSAAGQATSSAPRFKPQEVANTLWAFATLAYDPGALMLDAMASQISDKVLQFRPQAVSNSLWAYAKLGYNPGRLVLDISAQRATPCLHQYTTQEIANTLWALGMLEHHPGNALMDAAAVQIGHRIDQFSPQDTTNAIGAYAKLFHSPPAELVQAVGGYVLRHWFRFKTQEVANILWSLSLCSAMGFHLTGEVLHAPTPEVWSQLLACLGEIPVASFEEADYIRLYQVYLLLSGAGLRLGTAGALAAGFPGLLLQACERTWRAGVRQIGRLPKQHVEVSNALWALGVNHQNDFLTPDGLFCVAIGLENPQVVIEVDGPSQFTVNSNRPLGRTICRRCMLESRGYIVCTVPFYEWTALEGIEQQKAYMARVLAASLQRGGL